MTWLVSDVSPASVTQSGMTRIDVDKMPCTWLKLFYAIIDCQFMPAVFGIALAAGLN
jgi:hypothetical protein